MTLTSKQYETKDEKSGAAAKIGETANVVSLTPDQESLYGWVREQIDLDDLAPLTVRRLFARMRIDTACCSAVFRLVQRTKRDAENDSAYIVAGMKILAEEHKAGPTETE